MPRRFGFGLGFSLSRLTGAIREPSGFVAKYLSYIVSSMSLVTGDNVEQWDDQSANNNDLAQATSANQPVLVEQDVVKQSTLANMPTLIDTGGGVLAMGFGGVDTMNGLSPLDDFEYEFILTSDGFKNTSTNGLLQNITDTSIKFERQASRYILRGTDAINRIINSAILSSEVEKIELIKIGQLVKVIENDIEIYSDTLITDTFAFDRLGGGGIPMEADLLSFKEKTTNFELLPQTQYLRNNSNATASAGDSISAWLSTTHNANDNVVRFDATDDNMTPLPTTTGDFAMQFKKKANTLATTKVLFSSTTTSAEVRINTSNQFEVVSDGGTVFTFTTTLVASQQEVNIVQRNGNDLEVYDSIGTKQVLDVTGEVFTFDRVSDTANASDSDWQEIRVYDKALSQSSIDYFYYLRDANNEILLPPLLPS